MNTENRTGFRDIDELREANSRAWHHYFSADTMRLFRSRLPDAHIYGGRFFITSEQFEGSDGHREPRAYTVRTANLNGTIGAAVGGFQAWPTLANARTIARAAADGYAEGMVSETVTGGRYGASIGARAAYVQGRALRRFEDDNAPDKYGNTRANYLREDVKRLQAQIDGLQAQIAKLES